MLDMLVFQWVMERIVDYEAGLEIERLVSSLLKLLEYVAGVLTILNLQDQLMLTSHMICLLECILFCYTFQRNSRLTT
jgi:hypothetical protein